MLQKIGRYEIRGELGRGGMAVVYRAYDPRFQREVALKVLPREFSHDTAFRNRFEREARVIAALEHPAIVPVYDYGEHERQLYLAMRLMSGGSLASRITAGPLPVPEVIRIFGRLAPALDFAHSQGLVHRDLKPANILFDQWDEPYLSDFGIVKLLSESDTALTMTGGLVGTAAYMSPEQVMSQGTLDGRSDIYALGCILFEMLTGQLPYQGDTPIRLAFMHVNEPVPRLQERNATLPAGLETVVSRSMAKERENRYPTAGALVRAVRSAADAEKRAGPTTTAPPEATVVEPLSIPPRPVETPPSVSPPPVAPPARAEERVVEERSRGLLSGRVLAGLLGVLLLLCLLGGAVALAVANRNRQLAAGETEPTATATATVEEEVAQATEEVATPTRAETPEPTPTITPVAPPADAVLGDTWTRPSDGMVMVYVPAGSFMMGSDPEVDPAAQQSAQPVHEVRLDGFWLDETEVTNAQFAVFVGDIGYVTTADEEGGGNVPSPEGSQFIEGTNWQHPFGPDSSIEGLEDHPVLQVSWFDAAAYCEWAGAQLPTEAQWEYAARGADGFRFPGSDEFDGQVVNFCDASCEFAHANEDFDDSYPRTAPVGNFPDGATWVNALDMSGNVWEWVADWFSEGYYASSPLENPTGPAGGDRKVLRGGSWYDDVGHVRLDYRGGGTPTGKNSLFGFRCAMPAG